MQAIFVTAEESERDQALVTAALKAANRAPPTPFPTRIAIGSAGHPYKVEEMLRS